MAGIWGRNDDTRGVHKAPANEVVRGAVALETQITRNEHGLLNPTGVNCIRAFPGGGIEGEETPEQAAVRETAEEVGLEVKAVRILGDRVHPQTGVPMTYVACELISGDAIVGDAEEIAAIADDLLLHGLWQTNMPSAVLVILASALLAVATLAGFARTFWGAPQRRLAPDLGSGERLAVAGLVVWLLVLGFVPRVLVA